MNQRPEKSIYPELNINQLQQIEADILKFWKDKAIFQKSLDSKEPDNRFNFYEGPPSANGMPGIHHVVGRTYKDLFCRYKSLQGFAVPRKGGWDTHGLPIELQVEKKLQITKEDIGKKISIEDYNQACKETVLEFQHVWESLTEQMGYWLDLENPYITYKNEYIESVWHIVKEIANKNLIYRGYTIQPYSPAAGTGLSTHELNQPGAYKEVSDTTAVACFEILEIDKVNAAFGISIEKAFFLAWTTTPWTLPANTALALGPEINYSIVKSLNPYTKEVQHYILATDLIEQWFDAKHLLEKDKNLEEKEYLVLAQTKGKQLSQIAYHQLMPFEANAPQKINGACFHTILGQFVTTTDGTGIVHIAPSFGADDRKVANENGIGELKLVDLSGKFIDGLDWLSGRYVKDYKDEQDYKAPDIDIVISLKTQGKAFNVKKYIHSYPHCWRTDKPIIYYPLDAWFIRTSQIKSQLINNNHKINWYPESTGSGRFGQWLENIQDWNFSRSRFWGIPIPIWIDESQENFMTIGSISELKALIEESLSSNLLNETEKQDNRKFLDKLHSADIDLHKPYIDWVTLVQGDKKYKRVSDVLDVWFDSGAMPYAQHHYPFSMDDANLQKFFPADFIAEGVDQTRGWFYTLHVLSTILFDTPAYKNVISNGLLLDSQGEKMSKRKGNVVDPFKAIETYGADSLRWYIVSNSAPWENIKFDLKGVEETKRKFFGTLVNTYSFFTLYANLDQFIYEENEFKPTHELDRWILSKLNSLILEVASHLDDYDSFKAIRAIQNYLDRHLSNWYVRLSRRRFWKNYETQDKIDAYQTLYLNLVTLSQIMSPFAPFLSDWLYINLTKSHHQVAKRNTNYTLESVHLSNYPKANLDLIDLELEKTVDMAQNICSLGLSLRKKEKIKVRQPLNKILIPILKEEDEALIRKIEALVKAELNIKTIDIVPPNSGLFQKKAKPKFKELGKILGKDMGKAQEIIQAWTTEEISKIETMSEFDLDVNGKTYRIHSAQIEILTDDMPGFTVARDQGITIALDLTLDQSLIEEGIARELVNRIQNFRKEAQFEVTDRINITLDTIGNTEFDKAIETYRTYIMEEVLADNLSMTALPKDSESIDINDIYINWKIFKI
ncbi:MAG: isoleucine--tRNA ligase [Chitinophagales bacterium]|jgi:isoleucyl-tRNA synthetase|nr:isoleucine--tRNA ligase [Chitinophagales bacterium]